MADKITLIDTHAHLDDIRFKDDRDIVIQRARDAGVRKIISVGCWSREKGFKGLLEVLSYYDFIYAALGVHPHEAKDAVGGEPLALIRKLALESTATGNNRVVAIGETGLDYHYEHSPKDVQKKVFADQLDLARELALPVVIHSREAEKDTFEVLKGNGHPEHGGVFHCFSGTKEMARKALDAGFYLSFTGVVTYPKATDLQDVVRYVPVERMLVETDCPYLSPVPQRGKRNEPAFVVNVANAIASLKGLTFEDVGRITTLNAEELFGLKREDIKARIAYPIRESLYLNITNRCSNYCSFCAKFKSYTVKGHYLKLGQEPTAAEVLASIGPDPLKYDEIVFCGFGEPLIRLDVVKEVGMTLKKRGCRIRIDTDGLANLVHGRNVLPELQFVDTISVSLNAPDSATYQKLIKTPFGDNAYPAILYFLREAKKHIAKVVASAVTVPGIDIEACRRVAEDEIGVAFRARQYDSVG